MESVTGIIIVTMGALLFVCAFWFGMYKTFSKVYCALKYVFFKPIEWVIRLIVALVRINVYLLGSLGLLALGVIFILPDHVFGITAVFMLLILGWAVLVLLIRNFRDEDDRDFIRMLLARAEHKLCFKDKKLSLYPDDWYWEN